MVEGLGGDFAGVVHPHKGRRFEAISLGRGRRSPIVVRSGVGYGPRSVSGGEDGAERPVGCRDKRV